VTNGIAWKKRSNQRESIRTEDRQNHGMLTPRQRIAHLKTSRVRRGEQGKGAREADIVVGGRQWWFELQHASGTFNPEGKLAQAEKDIAECGETNAWHPISICHKTGERTIWCAMRIPTLILLATGKFAEISDAAIVRIPYDALLRMLASDEARP
jgi:hypothetical protein